MKAKPSITTFQYGIFIVGALIANGIFSLPRTVSQDAGRTAWVVVAVMGAVVFAIAALAHLVASHYPGQDPAEWSLTLLGPVLGRLWLLVYLIKSCFFAVLTGKIFAAIVTSRMLITTPSSIIVGIILAISVLAVFAKLGGLARFSEMSVLIWAPLLILIVLVVNRDHFFTLQPIFGDASVSDLLKSSRQALYSYAGFDILLFAYPHLRTKKGSVWALLWGMAFVTAVYVVTTISATTFLGLEQMTRILLPTLTILSIIETSVIERFDSLALFLWVGIVVVTAATQLYMATRAIQGILKGAVYHKTIIALGSFLFLLTWGDTPLLEVVRVSDFFGIFDIPFVAVSMVVFLVLIYIKKAGQKDASPT